MTVESPPAFEQGSVYGAVVLRRAFGTLLQRGASIGSIVGGLVGSGDMQVTAGSGLQVLVAPGEGWISGSSVSNQSGYYGRVESSTALAISASNESLPRIETIIAQVKDKAYAGTEETFTVSVVAGVATSGATLGNKLGAGAVPASSLVLAYVLVPAKAVSILAGNIVNQQALVTLGLPPLGLSFPAGSFTATTGFLYQTTGAVTMTLPAPAFNAITGVAYSGGTTTVTASSGVIVGDFVSGAGTVTLTERQHLLLMGNGTNWLIIAGEPKREQKYEALKSYTKVEAEAGVEPGGSRPAYVVFNATPTGLTIGGVTVTAVPAGYLVLPGQKWKMTVSIEASTVLL